MSGIRGIHYEFSKPLRNPDDGHYYQRIRQVDENGNLVGIGEEVHRSVRPDSTDGLTMLPIDLGKLGSLAGDIGQMAWGGLTRKPGTFAGGALKFTRDVSSGLTRDYASWPGTDKPWDPPFDWQTGSPGVDFLRDTALGAIGDGSGVGNWWNNLRFPPLGRSQGDATAHSPFPNFPALPFPGNPLGKDASGRDSTPSTDMPGRNDAFGYRAPPDSGPAQAMGGLPGLIATVAGVDPSQPERPMPAPGGLLGLMLDQLNNRRSGDVNR
jgi:hypothetical protein